MNCLEKEIKVLHVDLLALIVKLESIGAKRVAMGSVCDHYYDMDDGGLHRRESKRIRIRYGIDGNKITMKKRLPSDSMKIAEEDEYYLQDHHGVKQLLHDRGLVPKRQKYKTRMTYVYEDMQYDIDLYPGIPPLVEIEALTEKKVQQAVALVGLEDHIMSTSGAVGLMKRYGKTPVPLH